jgi:hypothetical protein
MWHIRISHLVVASAVSVVVAGLCVVGMSLVVGSPTSASAVGLFEAGVFALCSVLAALVAVAGVLLVTDTRDENSQTRAWQSACRTPSHSAELSAGVVATTPWPYAYATEPQSEDLRAIFRTYRLAIPLTAPGEAVAATKVAPIADNTIEPEPPTVASDNSVACASVGDDRPVRGIKTINAAGNQDSSATIASKSDVNAETIRIQHLCRSMRGEPMVRRVANAGSWSSSHDHVLVAPPWCGFSGWSAHVIVLADRSDRTNPQHNSDQLGNATAPSQPACRGPPSATFASSSAPKQSAFGKRHRPKIDVSTEPDALVFVDNLGNRAPIGAAELDVVETYLDDVLSTLLATAATDRDGRAS